MGEGRRDACPYGGSDCETERSWEVEKGGVYYFLCIWLMKRKRIVPKKIFALYFFFFYYIVQ